MIRSASDRVLTSWLWAAVILAIAACATWDAAATAAEQGPLISNAFLEADLRSALYDVAQQAGVHIIVDDNVNGTVSVDLDQVPLEEALKLMLMAGGHSFRKIDANCYLVGTGDPQSPTFNLLSTTAVIPLHHIKAEKASDLLLSDYFRDYLKVDPSKNVVVVTAPQAIIDRVVADLKRIDVPRSQVLIEAVIVDVQAERAKEFLSDWRLTTNVPSPEDTRTIAFEGLTLGYTSLHMRELLVALRALVTNGIARIRAEPSVSTLDGEQAEIFVGREEYFSILAGGTITYPYYRLESIKSGITLRVLPRIVEDDLITLEFSPEVSDVVARGEEGLPVVSRRRVTTTVRVSDGETVVVGGLAAELVRKERAGVPLLRDLPLVGVLFSRTATSYQKDEVMVLLTPHIVRGPGLAPVSEAEQSPSPMPTAGAQPLESGSGAPFAGAVPSAAPVAAPAVAPEARTSLQPAPSSASSLERAAAETEGVQELRGIPTPVEEPPRVQIAANPTQDTPPPSLDARLSPSLPVSTTRPGVVPPRSPAAEPERQPSTEAPRGQRQSGKPILSIVTPLPNTIVKRGEAVEVRVSVEADRSVERVWLWLNQQLRAIFGKPPYEMQLTTEHLLQGRHRLEAVARLDDGEWLRSEAVWVEIVDIGQEGKSG